MNSHGIVTVLMMIFLVDIGEGGGGIQALRLYGTKTLLVLRGLRKEASYSETVSSKGRYKDRPSKYEYILGFFQPPPPFILPNPIPH